MALMATGGYLLGAVPFGVVVTKCLGAVDPRYHGSRNVGFTNVLRVAGKKAGILTLLGDMGKGGSIGWLAAHLFYREEAVLMVALTPVVGHLYSVFLKFRGGKGVATALGVVVGIAPLIGLVAIGVWLATVWLWRYSSVGALTAFGLLPIVSMGWGKSWLFVAFATSVSLLIWMRHKENVLRLWNGTESRIGHIS